MKAMVYIAVALVAGALGYVLYHYGSTPATAEDAARAAASAVTAEPDAQAGPELPQTLPDFTLADRDGTPRSIRSWPGKSMIVNFWATWCGPCRREIPLLKELQRQRGAQGFQIVGVAVDFRDDVLKYAAEIGIDYPILIGEQDGLDAVSAFGLSSIGFPFTVFTDEQARIVAYHLGELTQAQADVLLAVVARVNRGELTPEAARAVAAKQLAALPAASG